MYVNWHRIVQTTEVSSLVFLFVCFSALLFAAKMCLISDWFQVNLLQALELVNIYSAEQSSKN